MARNESTGAVIDGILRIIAVTGGVSVALISPRMIEVLDKPASAFWQRLDKRAREREIKRVLYNMKACGLVSADDYDHGISLTKEGHKRLEKIIYNEMQILKPPTWDGRWRIVIYDIPDRNKYARDTLKSKLKQLKFYHLQKSVFVHPYPCREEIYSVAERYGVQKYVSYFETDYIDQQHELINKFRILLEHKV